MGQGFLTTALLIACAFGQATMAKTDSSVDAVAKSNTEFTSSLYDVLTKSNEGNLIFSPFSLSAVMAMLKAGAAGKTAVDVQTAMKFPNNDDTLNEGYSALLKSLKSDGENFTLEAANKIYTQTGFALKPEFTNDLKNYYGADVKQLDFSDSAGSAKEINDFVSTTTRDKIKDLISPSDLDSMTKLVLVNAIYFKGLWKNKFNKEYTSKKDFFLTEKNIVQVDMMRLDADLPYAEIRELNAKAVALPYKGDRLSMIILLPNEKEGLKDMETRLQNFKLSSLPERFNERKVNLLMPKFTLESTIDLKEPLISLGAGSIFDPNEADFSGIVADPKQKLFVSKAVQKAFIEVNEEGSEAAAATGYVFQLMRPGPPSPAWKMNVDHPFMGLIFYGDQTDSQIIVFAANFYEQEDASTSAQVVIILH